MAASRTFDITMAMRGGGEFQFSNINREEQKPLEDFFRTKNLKIKNEMAEEEKMTKAILSGMNDDESDDEVVADRGSADEDSEEADEDFQDDDDSDVAEEFDSQHASSGGESDEEMAEADAGSDGEPAAEERPKKKAKTGK
jgi:structure-specific recognition protein 1